MKFIATISRIFVGIVFTFSGFVKAVDPLGTVYKNIDYFNDAFHLPQLVPTAFVLSIIMCAAELVVGILLLINVLPKLASWGSLLLMLFFTPLTLYLAIFDPVSDCGCFGDALILTNWQTFWKNVIIMIPVLIFFFMRKKFRLKSSRTKQWTIALTIMALAIGFEFYNLNNLPLIDFRPYKIGNYLPELMTIPEGEPVDEYETVLVYKNKTTGEEQEFTLENYPWDNEEWEWVSTDSKLVSEGYKPPIHDFTIVTQDEFDITTELLSEEAPVFLFVAYSLDKTAVQGFIDVKEIWDYSEKNEYYFYCLTASLKEQIEELKKNIEYELEFCNTDEIQLKTIVRANPGLVLLKKGTVIGKWHWKHLPTTEEIDNLLIKYKDK